MKAHAGKLNCRIHSILNILVDFQICFRSKRTTNVNQRLAVHRALFNTA